ncbi:hypothetical protein DSLASN_49740 [Desulfoluna limicola]|uniref:Uncharacterized protein n=1 Tax=Desulfoluna limicola TaxID=2810562 RepID=A0ABM7PP68_9BACT|nr:hypothetical protein DSLASN_49740 [Desulfoluna limicola]
MVVSGAHFPIPEYGAIAKFHVDSIGFQILVMASQHADQAYAGKENTKKASGGKVCHLESRLQMFPPPVPQDDRIC